MVTMTVFVMIFYLP